MLEITPILLLIFLIGFDLIVEVAIQVALGMRGLRVRRVLLCVDARIRAVAGLFGESHLRCGGLE